MRAWYISRGLEDPWIKAGGAVDRYVPAPGTLTPVSDSYRNRAFETHIGTFYQFPWGASPS